MPRPSRTPIGGAEVAAPSRPPVALEQPFHAVDTFVAPDKGEMDSLLKGLSSLHEPFARIHDKQAARDQHNANIEAQARVARAPDVTKLDGADLALGDMAPAVRPGAALAFRESIGKRLGMDAQDAFLEQYQQEHGKPDFNFDAFAAKFREDHLRGLTDPQLAVGAAAHIDQAMQVARGAYRQFQYKKASDDSRSALAQDLGQLDPSASLEYNQGVTQQALDAFVKRGFGTRAEGVDALLDQIAKKSEDMGSGGALFDVLNMTDPATGRTLAELNPQKAPEMAARRERAEHHFKTALALENLRSNAAGIADLQQSIDNGATDSMSDADFRGLLLSKYNDDGSGLLRERGEIAHWEHYRFERMAKVAVARSEKDVIQKGLAGSLPEERQRANLAEAMQPQLAILTGQAKGDAGLALRDIASYTAAHHFSVGLSSVKGLMSSVGKMLPTDGGTRPELFNRAAEFYRDLKASGNPKLIDENFDTTTAHVMEAYLRETANGAVTNDEAWRHAYRAADPAARERADKMSRDPVAVAANVQKAHEALLSFRQRHTPFGKFFGVAPDTSTFDFMVQDEMKNYAMTHPDATVDEIADHSGTWSRENFFHDKTTNRIIPLARAYNDEGTQSAISDWLGQVKRKWSVGGEDVTPILAPLGADKYKLVLKSSSGAYKDQAEVYVKDIKAAYDAQKHITGDEWKKLGELRAKLGAGTLTPQEAADNAAFIQKATDLGALSGDIAARAYATRQAALPPPSNVFAGAAAKGEQKASFSAVFTDRDANTTPVVQQFLKQGNLAGALTAVSERVRLVAYKDPARGTNIGLGYNMDENAKTIADDFRRATIPPEFIPDIKAGLRSITTDQAMRLFGVTQARYEDMAKRGFQSQPNVAPGEWERLTPNVRAVLTDLAYQAGHIDKFTNGLAALRNGDLSGAGLETTFKDRTTKTRRTDDRRHAWRVAMLKNETYFTNLFNYAAKRPASSLEGRAVLANSTQ